MTQSDPRFHRPQRAHGAPSIWRAKFVDDIHDSDRWLVVRSGARVLWIDYDLGRALGEHAGSRDVEVRRQSVWDAALAVQRQQRRKQRMWFALGAVAGGAVYALVCAALHGMKG